MREGTRSSPSTNPLSHRVRWVFAAAFLALGCARTPSAPPARIASEEPSRAGSAAPAEAATPPEPPEGSDPTAVDILVWGRVAETPGTTHAPRTYWLRAGDATYQLKGHTDAVLIAEARQVWRLVVVEYEHKVVCHDPDMQQQLGATTTSLGLRLESVGAQGSEEVIRSDTNPLGCESIRSPEITLAGSVGSYLFIRDERLIYSGGAHGITMDSFLVHDVATGKEWKDWSQEVTVPPADIERLKESLGQPPGSRGEHSGNPFVALTPSSLRSSCGPDGTLSIHVCFSVRDTNIPELGPMLSRGTSELGDCLPAPMPARLAVHGPPPATVVRFARGQHLTLGVWSRLAEGERLPPAVQAMFGGQK